MPVSAVSGSGALHREIFVPFDNKACRVVAWDIAELLDVKYDYEIYPGRVRAVRYCCNKFFVVGERVVVDSGVEQGFYVAVLDEHGRALTVGDVAVKHDCRRLSMVEFSSLSVDPMSKVVSVCGRWNNNFATCALYDFELGAAELKWMSKETVLLATRSFAVVDSLKDDKIHVVTSGGERHIGSRHLIVATAACGNYAITLWYDGLKVFEVGRKTEPVAEVPLPSDYTRGLIAMTDDCSRIAVLVEARLGPKGEWKHPFSLFIYDIDSQDLLVGFKGFHLTNADSLNWIGNGKIVVVADKAVVYSLL